MMERLQKKLEVRYRGYVYVRCGFISAFGKSCSCYSYIQSQWTKAATFIHKIMNSTLMSLSLEQTGEIHNSKISNLMG